MKYRIVPVVPTEVMGAAGWTAELRVDRPAIAHRTIYTAMLVSAPEVSEEMVERAAQKVHEAYLVTCMRLGWDVKPENNVPYADLDERSKELDRASVRAVIEAIQE